MFAQFGFIYAWLLLGDVMIIIVVSFNEERL